MKQTLIENVETMPKTLFPKIDVQRDLFPKKDFITNSWFVCGQFETEGRKLNYFYDVLLGGVPGQAEMVVDNMSVTDQTSKECYHFSEAYPLSMCEVGKDEFFIKTPHAEIFGNLDELHLLASMENVDLQAKLVPTGYPIFNAGDGNFMVGDMISFQYSVPKLNTSGTLAIKGHEYELSGISWFDRQWGGDLATPMDAVSKVPMWGWMDLNLSNGEFLSLWFLPYEKGEVAWATVLHEDGSQSVLYVEPMLKNASDYWTSELSGISYPTRWVINMPDTDAKLEVVSDPQNQEVFSEEVPSLTHYEGASIITGTYKGENVHGKCYVELMNWR